MTEVIKREEYKGYEIQIYLDKYPESPREWDNLGTMSCKHSRYNLGDGEVSIQAVEALIKQLKHDDLICLPLYLYDHSGVSISTESFVGRVPHAEWDSSHIGFIWVTKEKVKEEYGWKHITKKREEEIKTQLRTEVEMYNRYLRGEVYGYTITKLCGVCEQEEFVDSCWGYFGFDFTLEEAKEHIHYLTNQK